MYCHSSNYTDSYVLSNTNSYSTDKHAELQNLEMEQDFKTWLERQLSELSTTATAVARESAGLVNQPTLQRILSGETGSPGLKVIDKIERAIAAQRKARGMKPDNYTGNANGDGFVDQRVLDLSETAIQIAAAVNQMSPLYQEALLALIKQDTQKKEEIPPVVEDRSATTSTRKIVSSSAIRTLIHGAEEKRRKNDS